jgi:hypothetical protein
MIAAHNAQQAEYLVRSRAEQRGVDVDSVDVSGGNGGMWLVTVNVADPKAGEAARLSEDTQALHLNIRGTKPPGSSAG